MNRSASLRFAFSFSLLIALLMASLPLEALGSKAGIGWMDCENESDAAGEESEVPGPDAADQEFVKILIEQQRATLSETRTGISLIACSSRQIIPHLLEIPVPPPESLS